MTTRWGSAGLIAVGVFLFSCERIKPPLRVTQENGSVVIDVQSLGEYPTDVSRLKLTEAESGAVVWEVVPGPRGLQFNTIVLRAGSNSADQPTYLRESPRVLTPRGRTFILEPGKRYELTIWGVGTARVPARAEFRL